MRITQLMVSKGFGGAERYFVDLTLALADAGHTVQAVCHDRFVRRSALESHGGIEFFATPVRGAWDVFARRRMQRAIAAFAPQIIQGHLARGTRFSGHIAHVLGIPLVSMTHNYVDLKYYRHVDLLLPATEDQRRYLIEQGVPATRLRVIPNFSSHAPVEVPAVAGSGPVHFITAGRFVPKKGFDILLQAFAQLLKQDADLRLTIGGDGPERESLVRMISDLGLQGRVTLAGWIDDVAAFLAQGDVFVLPSLDEPFGIVVLEAMAAGKPVVTTRTQGPREFLNDDTAFFAEIGDVPSLTRAMAVALDPAARHRHALAASALYRTRYHADAVVPRIEAAYRSLVEGKSGARDSVSA